MFNGIIFNTGKVKTLVRSKKSIFIKIQSKLAVKNNDIGSSISCNGVCLTVVKIIKNYLFFYISEETLRKSNLQFLKVDELINLERSITFGQKISGHFIQGHVDTTAKINKIDFTDKSWILRLALKDNKLKKFLEEKASISINGVSLTISKVTNDFFEIYVIPHTLKLTNLRYLKINNIVNVELDILSKYIYKYSN